MMAPPVAGIDPHQEGFTGGVVDANGVELAHASFDNCAAGFADAIDMLRSHRVAQVGVEAPRQKARTSRSRLSRRASTPVRFRRNARRMRDANGVSRRQM
jgi:hypothetical protein